MSKGNYHWKTFKHWANLAALGGVGIAAAAGGGLPLLGLALLAEGAVLWIAPDIKGVQKALDKSGRGDAREGKRRYYAKVLWDVEPPKGKASGMFVEEKTNWRDAFGGQWDRSLSAEQKTFLRLLEVVEELETLRQHRPEDIAPAQVEQVEDAVNIWLQRLYLARGIKARLGTMNQADLVSEFESLQDRAKRAESRADRIVLGERLRTLKNKVEELPKLEQRLGLALVESERVVNDVEGFLLQVKTSGGADVGLLDGMVDRYDMLDSDFDRVMVAAEVRGLVSGVDDEDAWQEVADGLGLSAKETQNG